MVYKGRDSQIVIAAILLSAAAFAVASKARN